MLLFKISIGALERPHCLFFHAPFPEGLFSFPIEEWAGHYKRAVPAKAHNPYPTSQRRSLDSPPAPVAAPVEGLLPVVGKDYGFCGSQGKYSGSRNVDFSS